MSAASYGVSVMMLWDYFYRTAAWGHFACVAMNYSAPICAVGECSVFFGNQAKEGAALFSRRETEIKRSLPLLYEASPQMYVWRPSPRPPWAFRVYIHDRAVGSHTRHLLHRHHSNTRVPACSVPHTLTATLPGLPPCQLFLWALTRLNALTL